MLAISGGQSVVGSGYWKHNITNENILMLVYLDLSQILMIW